MLTQHVDQTERIDIPENGRMVTFYQTTESSWEMKKTSYGREQKSMDACQFNMEVQMTTMVKRGIKNYSRSEHMA